MGAPGLARSPIPATLPARCAPTTWSWPTPRTSPAGSARGGAWTRRSCIPPCRPSRSPTTARDPGRAALDRGGRALLHRGPLEVPGGPRLGLPQPARHRARQLAAAPGGQRRRSAGPALPRARARAWRPATRSRSIRTPRGAISRAGSARRAIVWHASGWRRDALRYPEPVRALRDRHRRGDERRRRAGGPRHRRPRRDRAPRRRRAASGSTGPRSRRSRSPATRCSCARCPRTRASAPPHSGRPRSTPGSRPRLAGLG